VACSATDASHNTASGSFHVTVRDTTAPTLTLPTAVSVEAAGTLTVVSWSASATDLVNGAVAVTCVPASGSSFTIGASTVSCSASDAAHNVATGSFVVTVRDTTAPAGTIVLNGGAAVTGTPTVTVALAFTDAVSRATELQARLSTDGTTWTAWQAYASTATIVLPGGDGPKTVYVQVRDAAGNVGNASARITLSTQPPVIAVTGVTSGSCDVCSTFTFVYKASSAAGFTVTSSATFDGKSISSGSTIDTFYLAAGDHRLVITATDQYGKTSTQTITLSVHATIEGLICAVNKGVQLGLIGQNQKQPLLAKLAAAQAARDRGNVNAEIGTLTAFIHDLEAQRGKAIDTATANRFIGWTLDLLSRLAPGSGDDCDEHGHEHCDSSPKGDREEQQHVDVCTSTQQIEITSERDQRGGKQ
jgi:hypothetical protein